MALVGDGVLAVSQGVPELDGAVTGSGNDLAVVGGEGNGEDIVGVTDECPGGLTGGELPQAERLVPRRGQSVGTVGGNNLYPNTRISQPNPKFCTVSVRSANRSMASFGFRVFSRMDIGDIHSRRRCGSGPKESAWGNRRPARRG